MKKKKIYTKEELLDILKKEYKKNPNTTCRSFRVSNGLPQYTEYIKAFGGFSEALFIAGIKNTNRLCKNIQKSDIKNKLLQYNNETHKVPILKEFIKYSGFSRSHIIGLFENYDNLLKECDLYITKEEFLISEIKRFVDEFGRIPIQSDFEGSNPTYPNRKTFTKYFENFNEAIKLAGFEPKYVKIEYNEETKKDMIKFLKDFYKKYRYVPVCADMYGKKYKYNINNYTKMFGTYNNALKEAGIPISHVSQYSDDFLHNEFERFIKEHGRTPYLHEFNNSEYPSFWCYQHRFGSWNKTFIAYGYEPNDSNRKYYMNDGEVCYSSYEFDISKWLKENKIEYTRDVKYNTFIPNYKGKMDCDYKINYNNQIWYVEMAGYMPHKGACFDKWSDAEKKYFFKIKYKEKMLKENNLNYLIIPPSYIKNKTMNEIFSFIKL